MCRGLSCNINGHWFSINGVDLVIALAIWATVISFIVFKVVRRIKRKRTATAAIREQESTSELRLDCRSKNSHKNSHTRCNEAND